MILTRMNDPELSSLKADILIVDDTPANLRLLSTMMVDRGYNVRQAINGQMALTATKAMIPDLILLDINMPGMSGYEVCEKLKQDSKTADVPVIFLSAFDDINEKVKAFKVGGSDYITKPFEFEEVIVRIQNQLTIQQLQKQLQDQNQQLQTALGELRMVQAQLIQKEKMASLAQLVAGIAHEINNPVSFISGNISYAHEYIQSLLSLIALYQKEYPNPSETIQELTEEIDLDFLILDIQKIMGSMKTGVDRIRTIILALKIFSRLDESDIKTVDLHQGIESTLLFLQHRIDGDDQCPAIQIVKDYQELPLVTCYASQINQVFYSVLDNAIDALQQQDHQTQVTDYVPTLWISTAHTNPEKVIIRIKDNGIGIPEEIQPRLFDPFFTTKPVGGGQGLGLLTSYQIVVQKHKGHLICHSAPGNGAEFVIEIPIHLNNTSSKPESLLSAIGLENQTCEL
ncbi:MAG: response regulator [Microcoleaceae cyanobacterium]